MRTLINPFDELYSTETMRPEQFVNLFSDVLVRPFMGLFLPGNLFLAGVEGSGKSMLLNLLKPEIRIAYERLHEPFPVPSPHDKFLGAGVNLTKSAALDVAQSLAGVYQIDDGFDAPSFFGDFLNYFLVEDLVNSLLSLAAGLPTGSVDYLGIKATPEALDGFAARLSSDDCWVGDMNGVSTLADLKSRLSARIRSYRALSSRDPRGLTSAEGLGHRTTTAGEPLAQAVQSMWDSGVLGEATTVLVRIDQFEDLVDFSDLGTGLSARYVAVVNKFLSTRDQRVSYKVGARKYALKRRLDVHGTGVALEKGRHYQVIDIYDQLRRGESRSTWLFPRLADDAFARRLRSFGYPGGKLAGAFGRTPTPHKKARMTVKARLRVIETNSGIPAEWVTFLRAVAGHDPLSARLGQAWLLQKPEFSADDPPALPGDWDETVYRKLVPWEAKQAQWWKKERLQQALLQVSARCGQRMMWAGDDDILTLSGSNISIFVTLCKHVWDVWLMSPDTNSFESPEDVTWPIRESVQTIGVYAASSAWYERVAQRNMGNSRRRFIDVVGLRYYNQLKSDKKMSYPGRNGFSVLRQELEENSDVSDVLYDAVNYGDMVSLHHTPKNKNETARVKWFLQPILSPYFRIPASHTKEPDYVTVAEVRCWLREAEYNMRYATDAQTGNPNE